MGNVSKAARLRLASAVGSHTVSDEIVDRIDPITYQGADCVVTTPAGSTLALANTVYEDLRVSLTATNRGGTKDPGFAKILDNGAGSQGVFAYLFDAGIEEELYFMAQFPHNKKMNTAIKPHIHWSPTANGSAGQVVSWGLEYTWANVGQTMPATQIIYGNAHVPADASLVADRHYLTPIGSGLTISSETPSSILVGRIFRDATAAGATDSYTADAAGLYIDFHYEVDTLGSRTEYAK